MLSVHDNNVNAFSCDCDNRRIVLHTSFNEREPKQFTDVIFRDVLAHSFEHMLPGNILFDIREVTPDTIVDEYSEMFGKSWPYGWPIANTEYRGNLEYLKTWLREQTFRAFVIEASFGLCGWVFAQNCEFVDREQPFLPSGL